MTNNDDYVIEILLDTGLITQSQLDEAKDATPATGSVVETLIEKDFVMRDDVLRCLASHSNMEFVDLAHIAIGEDLIAMVPAEVAMRYKVVPVALVDTGLMMATADPLNFDTFDAVTHIINRDVDWVCAAPDQIQAILQKNYGVVTTETGEALLEGDDGDAPIIKMVTMLLLEAQKMQASDIHLEPLEKRFRVRFRIDGVLHEVQNPPKKLQSAIISRLKIMTGSMSIAEKRLPQDGRIQIRVGGKQIDLRVSTLPTNHGESIVMRILDKSGLTLGLSQLGFLSDDQETFERLITLPDGILLVTGPTGSGKTTTLYGCLNHINRPDRKIITVEDPVEYQLNGINQVQVNTDVGMTFPGALRSMLRQAPNIIMIGEIRDLETASIAINASLTGHLVFSTLHTNDAPSAVARLVDIGVQRFLVSSAVRAIVAQRLVRRLCPKCKVPYEMTDGELNALQLDRSQVADATVMRGLGCEACRHLGYKGRLGIFEIFLIDDEVRFMINEGASTIELRKRAREFGMRTLREDGVRKVLSGITTAEEVIAATMSDAN
ncbi:MAG: ATPase, T2SS/T4P/T4SS family [Verrucomicrobiota bacterium]